MKVCSWECRLRKQAAASVAAKRLSMFDVEETEPRVEAADDLDVDDDAVRIPLWARDGSVRAYAIVDAADAEWANQWRWHLNKGYATRAARKSEGIGKTVRLHRALAGLTYGDGLEADHRDLDKLNCRRRNLRVVPKGKNQQNQGGFKKTSQYRGVHWSTTANKWCVTFRVDGKTKYFGVYADELEAAKVAKSLRLQAMPYSYPITKGMVDDELLRPA